MYKKLKQSKIVVETLNSAQKDVERVKNKTIVTKNCKNLILKCVYKTQIIKNCCRNFKICIR